MPERKEDPAAHVHGPQFGFLGAPYVNVLELNEALSALTAALPPECATPRR